MIPGTPINRPHDSLTLDTPVEALKIVARSPLAQSMALREVAKWWDQTSAHFAARGDTMGAAAAAKHAAHYRELLKIEGEG
jgi:hypothetical protein